VGALSVAIVLVALGIASPVEATTRGRAIKFGEKFVPTLDGREMILYADGGWAACFVVDGGSVDVPVVRPRGYFEDRGDDGWYAVEFLADGGTLKVSVFQAPRQPYCPPGY
jgi:hypothetical protein